MKSKIVPVAVLLMIVLASAVVLASDSDADTTVEKKVLIDMGDGQTYWSEPGSGTVHSVLLNACTNNNLKFSDDNGVISVNGSTTYSIGGVTSEWRYYTYSSGWVEKSYSGTSDYDGSYIAIGFYPSGFCPTVTPDYKSAWTAIHGDSSNSGVTNNYDPSEDKAKICLEYCGDSVPACYATPLYANGHVIFQSQDYKSTSGKYYCHVTSYDLSTGSCDWTIEYPNAGYNLSTGAIYGGHLYFSKMLSTVAELNCVDLKTGAVEKTVQLSLKVDTSIDYKTGSVVMNGLSSIVYDSGHIFFGSSNGIVYCMDTELNEIWHYQMLGAVYPSVSVTVTNGYVYVGACDGTLYILNESTGELSSKLLLYYKDGGRVGTPAVQGDYVFVSYNDGQGMSGAYYGFAVLKFNTTTEALTIVKNLSDLAVLSNYQVVSSSGSYVYASGSSELYRVYTTGSYESMGSIDEIHGGFTLVNNTYFYGTDYDSSGDLVVYNMKLEKVASYSKPASVKNYSMGATVICGSYIISSSDSGAFVLKGALVDGKDEPEPKPEPEPVDPEPADMNFLIYGEDGFYLTVRGNGLTVLDALKDAVTTYEYSNYVEYSTTGVKSMFGLAYTTVDATHYRSWILYQWDATSSQWVISTSLMNGIYAEDNSAVMLYYGLSTVGSDTPAPAGAPEASDLAPLVRSDAGVRFLLESSSHMFIVVNGEGSTIMDAFKSACSTSSIPYAVSGGQVTLFGIVASGDVSWNGYLGSSKGWSLYEKPLTDSSQPDVFAFYYATSADSPTVSPSSIFAFKESGAGSSDWVTYIIAIIAVLALVAVIVYVYRGAKTRHMSFGAYLLSAFKPSETGSKVRQNKIRLLAVCTVGLVATVVMFLCSLAIGPSETLSLPDTFAALISAIGKHGQNLNFREIIVYQSRLPRALAALAVGIGLSIAGCVYQAIIRNPLVDPYIMGVSSGAGTFAVAALSANFTMFGLLSTSNYATPVLAILGGLLAFGLTLLIAEKAGGSSTNYVLAGVVVGLVFSAVQTLLLVTSSSDKINGSLSWLFGSFANVGWDTVWLIVFPAIALALVPLIWAKELNLVLLGEDQAKQMGLDVRRFNRWMLILASVLTSVCVAFVGIIGFVGMVIPHLSRMLLGGDHRLVMPASIMMGGALMLFADLLSKLLMSPTELPVGAITTLIGVPVFAYLLIKKGRMYSG